MKSLAERIASKIGCRDLLVPLESASSPEARDFLLQGKKIEDVLQGIKSTCFGNMTFVSDEGYLVCLRQGEVLNDDFLGDVVVTLKEAQDGVLFEQRVLGVYCYDNKGGILKLPTFELAKAYRAAKVEEAI